MPRTGTSSRPTPGRGFQRLPSDAGVQAQYAEPEIAEVPEWATRPFTLYISYLHGHVPEKMIFSVLRQAGLGMMCKQNAIELTTHKPRDGGHDFQSAKIHFDFLFTRGDDGERNLQVLDRLLHGGEDSHFQVVYQTARTNEKTGKPDPDRFWKVKAWKEGMRQTPSPSGAPAVKITLAGGSVGPKDASGRKPTAQELQRQAARRANLVKRTEPDADGFQQPKGRGASGAVASSGWSGAVSNMSVGGGFAALAEVELATPPPQPDQEGPPAVMTKTAKKNARRAEKRAERSRDGSPDHEDQSRPPRSGGGFSDNEIGELEAAVAAVIAAGQFNADAAAFMAENAIAEEGLECPAAWQLDPATGSTVIVPEVGFTEAEQLVLEDGSLVMDGFEVPVASRDVGGV